MATNRRNFSIVTAAAAFSVIIVTIVLTVRFRPRWTEAVPVAPIPSSAGLTSVREKGAVCLDGSTPQYYLDRGSGAGANSWLVHLEGGGWCYSVESCLHRSRTMRGSTLYMIPQGYDGIMSPVQSENPDFYKWNRVLVRYCDGASFSGDVEGEFERNGTKLFFRGQQIWEAVMRDLILKGLAEAEKAFLTGCSAGGVATLIHCDRFSGLLPKVGTVKCLSDAAFFLNENDMSGERSLQSFFNDVINLQNVEKNLQKDCLLTAEPAQCFFPREIIKHIATPIFVLNSAYDYAQIQYVLQPNTSDPQQHWLSCLSNIRNCDANQVQVLQGFRILMLNSLKEFEKNKQGGMFINSCSEHCQSFHKTLWHSPDSPRINNKTIAEAVGDWFFDRREVKEVDCAYPCDSKCPDQCLTGFDSDASKSFISMANKSELMLNCK